jgi:hypothetical protein
MNNVSTKPCNANAKFIPTIGMASLTISSVKPGLFGAGTTDCIPRVYPGCVKTDSAKVRSDRASPFNNAIPGTQLEMNNSNLEPELVGEQIVTHFDLDMADRLKT